MDSAPYIFTFKFKSNNGISFSTIALLLIVVVQLTIQAHHKTVTLYTLESKTMTVEP